MASCGWVFKITYGIAAINSASTVDTSNAVSAAKTVWARRPSRIGRGKGAAPRSEGPRIESMGLVFRAPPSSASLRPSGCPPGPLQAQIAPKGFLSARQHGPEPI